MKNELTSSEILRNAAKRLRDAAETFLNAKTFSGHAITKKALKDAIVQYDITETFLRAPPA